MVLEEQRNQADLIEVFKMAKNISSIPLSTFFELHTDTRTCGHSLKLTKHCCHLEIRRHFFSERVVNRWIRTQSQREMLIDLSPVWRRRGDQRWACAWTSLYAGPRGRFNARVVGLVSYWWVCGWHQPILILPRTAAFIVSSLYITLAIGRRPPIVATLQGSHT